MRFSIFTLILSAMLVSGGCCGNNSPRIAVGSRREARAEASANGECLSCKDAKKREAETFRDLKKDVRKTHHKCQNGQCSNPNSSTGVGAEFHEYEVPSDASQPQPNTPPLPPVTPPAVQPTTPPTPTTPVPPSANIGDLTPEVALAPGDQAIVDSVLNGSKDLDGRRNRILVAGDNFPGTPALLTYCVFDTVERDLLGMVKKFGANPADIRALRDTECTRANLAKHIDWVFADIQPGDQRFVFLSCHGSADTSSDGSITGIICTYDMISTNIWDETTEITLDYWKAKCQSVPKGCNVTLVFDLCHAGGDIRALLANKRAPRSVDGPAPVQARIAKATKRATLRDVNQYNVQFIPMCLDSELSEEGPSTGGMGTWGLWSAIDKDGAAAPATNVIRDANAALRGNVATQHIVVVGANNKQPLGQAAK